MQEAEMSYLVQPANDRVAVPVCDGTSLYECRHGQLIIHISEKIVEAVVGGETAYAFKQVEKISGVFMFFPEGIAKLMYSCGSTDIDGGRRG